MTQDIWTRIDNIDWDSLPHCKFSPERDLVLSPPKIFRELISPDQHERERALDRFLNLFSHQGSMKEGLYYAMPFLLEMVQDSNIDHKTEIFELLMTYAFYTRLYEVGVSHEPMDQLEDLYHRIYQQIESLTHYFLQRLFLDTGKTRINIIRLIGYLSTQAEITFFKLNEAFHTTSNMDELTAIFTALSIQLQDNPALPQVIKTEYHNLFWEIVSNEKYTWQQKIKNLLDYVSTYRAETSLEIERTLINYIIDNEDVWTNDPPSNFSYLYYAKYLGQERYINLLFTLAEQTINNQFFLWDILQLIFGQIHKEKTIIKPPLDKHQSRFFQLVLDNSSQLPLDDWSKRYYLPETIDEVKRLLQEDDKINK